MGPGGDAVITVLTLVAVWWLATHGKGNVAARLAAWGALLAAGWVVIAAVSPHAGSVITSVYATGAPAAVHGIASFIAQF